MGEPSYVARLAKREARLRDALDAKRDGSGSWADVRHALNKFAEDAGRIAGAIDKVITDMTCRKCGKVVAK